VLVAAAAIGTPTFGAHSRTFVAASPTIRVHDEAAFGRAVSTLRRSGGTIVLLPHLYRRQLTVTAQPSATLRIVGQPGVRVQSILLHHARNITIGNVTISPLGGDASIDVDTSEHVDLHDLLVTAAGTRQYATVFVPYSNDVTIRHSELTHCADYSVAFANCLRVRYSSHVRVLDNWFHDCLGCDFLHGRIATGLLVEGNRFDRTLPCTIGVVRCEHQDLIELFAGDGLDFERNDFGIYERGGAQVNLAGKMSGVTIVNNLFRATDPRVPGYRVGLGIFLGGKTVARIPHGVRIVNNTILSGAPRPDGFAGSIRLSGRYGRLTKSERPILANNVIALLEPRDKVCGKLEVSVSNVVLHGHGCSRSDRVGLAHLDARGRPTAASTLLIDRAAASYAPALDLTGRPRGARPDIGASEYRPAG
jgi:hypothetical protein